MSIRSTPPVRFSFDDNYGRNIGITSIDDLIPCCGCLCCVVSLVSSCPLGCASKTQCLCIYTDFSLCLISTQGSDCCQCCTSQARCTSVPSFQETCQICCADIRCGLASPEVPSLVACCFRTIYFKGICGSNRCCSTVRDLEVSHGESSAGAMRAAALTSDSVDTQGDTHETHTGSDSPSSQPVRDLAPLECRAPRIIILPLTLSEMSDASGTSTPAVMSPDTSHHGYYP